MGDRLHAVNCGGCEGLGSHRKFCPQHPDYHPWLRLAAMAEDIGDQIGANEPTIANSAYFLAGRIKGATEFHPWRRPAPVNSESE